MKTLKQLKIHFKTDKLLYIKTFNCRFIFHRHSTKINILKKFNYTLTCSYSLRKIFIFDKNFSFQMPLLKRVGSLSNEIS